MESSICFFQKEARKLPEGVFLKNFLANPSQPYESVWILEHRETHPFTLRFVPSLNLHLIFDLTGITDVEPFMVHTGQQFLDFNILPQTNWVGLQFKLWKGSSLVAGENTKESTYYANFDADWVNLLYFWLLDTKNNNTTFTIEKMVSKFEMYINASLHADFEKNFFEIISHTNEKARMGYSIRHQRRLFQKMTMLSPKQFKRVIRFQKSFLKMSQKKNIGLG
jgi:hypothetical protein